MEKLEPKIENATDHQFSAVEKLQLKIEGGVGWPIFSQLKIGDLPELLMSPLREHPLFPTDLKIRAMFGFVVTYPPTQKPEHLK